MTSSDIYVGALWLTIIYVAAYIFRRRYNNSAFKTYFIPGLSVKLFGAVAAGLIYYFYYGDGDTIYYFQRVEYLNWLFSANPDVAFKVFFHNPSVYEPRISGYLMAVRAWDVSQFMVIKIATLMSFITFKNYTGIALLFGVLSFTGVWALFRTFSKITPELTKEFAIACLFIPSVFFWGSGLFKDTISMGFVGWLTYATYMIFIRREKMIINGLVFAISAYVLFKIKAYIIMAFMPSLLFWVFFKYRTRIKNNFIRVSLTPVIIMISVGLAYFVINRLGGSGEYWSLDQMTDRAKDMQWWHTKVVELYGEGGGGSFYNIGSGDFSLGNIIRSFPLAVNVTFFRPYLWEANSPVMILSAIESLVLLFFTLKVLLKVGVVKAFRISIANPEVFFALLFSVIFAFAVGFTSFNFGALVRYKIPCIPFYVMALFMIRHHANILKNKPALASAE